MFGDQAKTWLSRATRIPVATLQIERMKGSTSSGVYRVQSSDSLPARRFVLRVLDNALWLADEPDLAEHEAAVLQEAIDAGLPAPELVAWSTADVGFGAPVVLMTFLDGVIDIVPRNLSHWINQLALSLAAIHCHRAPGLTWEYFSWVDTESVAVPTWTMVPALWEKAITIGLGPAPECPAVFIHRDYHPTNVLWQNSKLSGIVDWINACRGPAGVDVAHCRTNLCALYGPEAAARFLELYCQAAPDFVYHPYWDLHSLLHMTLPEPSFYGPWLDFGLARIPHETLRQRTDAYLIQILGHTPDQ